MARRKRFIDKKNAAKLGLKVVRAKYIPGESATDRHARRLEINIGHLSWWNGWCGSRGVRLDVTNNGHHWKFTKGGKVAEWWPSSAKLVLSKAYAHGIHAHDEGQVVPLLIGFFETDTRQ